MKKVLNLFVSIIVLGFFCFPSPSFGLNKSQYSHTQDVSITNNIYTVTVADTAPDYGTYTFATGTNHPATIAQGAIQDILYGGASLGPGTSYLTVRSYNTGIEYTSSTVPTASPGFTQADLDTFYTSTDNGTPNTVITQWDITGETDNFTIVQNVAIIGTTISDSRIRVTTTVTNNGETTLSSGIRYLWDIMVDGEDGSYCKTVNPYGSWLSTETQWNSPSFEQYQNVNNPSAPVFYINGSITGPAYTPAPTGPQILQFVDWGSIFGLAFDYTPTGQTIAGEDEDSAMVYYWGDNENDAIDIAAGSYAYVVAYMFAPMDESNPSVTPSPAAELPVTGIE